MKINQHIIKLLTVKKMRISGSWLSKTGMKAWALFALCSLLFVLSSCSDQDTPSPSLPQDQEEANNITLTFPDFFFGGSLSTRADDKVKDPIEASEGGLQSLHLLVLKLQPKTNQNDNNEEDVYAVYSCQEIKSVSTINGSINSEFSRYKFYNFRLGAGTYKLYLFGNIEEYWVNPDPLIYTEDTNDQGIRISPFMSYLSGATIDNKIISSEENINNLILNFNGLIPSGHLPMMCLPTQIYTKEDLSESLTDGKFTISENDVSSNKNLAFYAPLTFLCSKVRLTVLFDNTSNGFSKDFTKPDIQFTEEYQLDDKGEILYLTTNYRGIRVDNVKRETIVFRDIDNPDSHVSDGSESSDGSGNTDGSENSENQDFTDNHFTSISKTAYPSSNAADDSNKYFNIEKLKKTDSSPAYLRRLPAEESWERAEKRAWQSNAIYIPENLENNPTTIHVVPSGTDVNVLGYFIDLNDFATDNDGLKRDYFYDIVAKMIHPDKFAIGTSIKVNAWALHDVSATW